jgi:glutamate racemase
MTAREPVGVFDSGVGGLSVLREIRRTLPFEDLIYVADSAYAPYGERSNAFIEQRATAVVQFLIIRHAKAIVVACNTATGVAVDTLRSRFTLPIIGMEPAVKPAASATKSGVVGVLATTQTLSSRRFSRLLAQHGTEVEVVLQACPRLVDQVERGELSGSATRALVDEYVRPLLDRGADTIVLGCTHFPFLTEMIQEIAGPNVALIDPAVAVARELRRRLEADNHLSSDTTPGSEQFWTSGPPDHVQRVISHLLMHPINVQRIADFRM